MTNCYSSRIPFFTDYNSLLFIFDPLAIITDLGQILVWKYCDGWYLHHRKITIATMFREMTVYRQAPLVVGAHWWYAELL